ncbi:hypothetical protein [Sulfurimonas sp.]|uniref:hypothetical protein n=1 Tax=Sulfurimonas sp. TaxID=2022749 RepID=UPI0025ECE7BB|nr:hypothetical protein [Sulfurimonas sp.]MDD5156580.1 hypothetical protein [Sulfurimonas sp.]
MTKKQFSFISAIVAIIICILGGCSTYFENQNTQTHDEKYYQTKMCNELKGTMEYVLFDRTRVDCLTDKYAIEVDFAKKWAESIGQALYYADVTNKEPVVALIVGKDDERYIERVKRVAKTHGIKVMILDR